MTKKKKKKKEEKDQEKIIQGEKKGKDSTKNFGEVCCNFFSCSELALVPVRDLLPAVWPIVLLVISLANASISRNNPQSSCTLNDLPHEDSSVQCHDCYHPAVHPHTFPSPKTVTATMILLPGKRRPGLFNFREGVIFLPIACSLL